MSTKSILGFVLLCTLPSLLVDCSARKIVSPDWTSLAVTTRRQFMQTTGRIRWAAEEITESWNPHEVGIIITDMWDEHWCPSATERVQSLAILINNTINVARSLGVHIIHAPSDTDDFYVKNPSRLWTLALPNVTMPNVTVPPDIPPFPISTSAVNAGCDVPGAYEHKVWTRETDLITIHPEDALIEDSDGGQTLWNLIIHFGLKYLVYVGVHENMCIMNRSFAITITSNWKLEGIAITREATDTMYEPSQPPYCSHEMSVSLMTQYIEKFWGMSVSVYDFLNPRNTTARW